MLIPLLRYVDVNKLFDPQAGGGVGFDTSGVGAGDSQSVPRPGLAGPLMGPGAQIGLATLGTQGPPFGLATQGPPFGRLSPAGQAQNFKLGAMGEVGKSSMGMIPVS